MSQLPPTYPSPSTGAERSKRATHPYLAPARTPHPPKDHHGTRGGVDGERERFSPVTVVIAPSALCFFPHGKVFDPGTCQVIGSSWTGVMRKASLPTRPPSTMIHLQQPSHVSPAVRAGRRSYHRLGKDLPAFPSFTWPRHSHPQHPHNKRWNDLVG